MSPNMLAAELSPYLRQHGDDPVDWLSWGPSAFARAKESGRPIFLSVGYASCHWCHVMHRESFADEATARLLNENFVPVKVDRESRPDVDEVYMAYVAAATGRGGWPMSVFLTSNLVPVFGGTYFPPSAMHGMPSFPDVVDSVASAFRERPEEIWTTAEQAMDFLTSVFAPLPEEPVSASVPYDAARSLISAVDPIWGGFGGASKFPQSTAIDFLLAYYEHTDDESVLDSAVESTRRMLGGGIFDHVGGGMYRYTVDREWLVPHFEKMLYDNAQLLSTLSALHRLKPSEDWAHAMRRTAEFLERDLSHPSGAFASSLDADTAGVEGDTYVWGYSELRELLTAEELQLAERHLGVLRTGNWEGKNIITRREGLRLDHTGTDTKVEAILDKLFAERVKRPQPALDDKVIVAWNALAVRGLLAAGEALRDGSITHRAVALLKTVTTNAVDSSGDVRRLLGDHPESAFVLEDAAGLCVAMLETAEKTGDAAWLGPARSVFDRAVERFYDGGGTWYLTAADTEFPVRPRERHDGPSPSGSSLAALAALHLDGALPGHGYRMIAEATCSRFVTAARTSPLASGTALVAILESMRED